MTSISQQNPVKIFAAHGFEPSEDYLRVFEYLESSHNFFYLNCSNPDYRGAMEPEKLREELRRQIGLAEVVIVPSALFAKHREFVNFEVNCAKGMGKPVIVLEAFGVKEKIPVQLEALGEEIVGWNERALVDAIRRQARHEETTRWDTIEFKMD
ncbi:MAG TPA: TIR domain-containing protein [Steroidobacteraceae bacterium]|nr:TIR domain-containing protein [Steroidobacteraceae bacterium]